MPSGELSCTVLSELKVKLSKNATQCYVLITLIFGYFYSLNVTEVDKNNKAEQMVESNNTSRHWHNRAGDSAWMTGHE